MAVDPKRLVDEASQRGRVYLVAAARALETGDWTVARRAYRDMSATNSRWYVDVQPRETDSGPCGPTAGYGLTFGRVRADSLEWLARLGPAMLDELAVEVASLVPGRYAPRQLGSGTPQLIDVIVNAGAARLPSGAVAGRASEQRTVVFGNLYSHVDARATRLARAARILDASSTASGPTGAEPLELVPDIMHELAHHLGPLGVWTPSTSASSVDDDALASELQARAGALFLIGLLSRRGVLSEAVAERAYLAAIMDELVDVASTRLLHWPETGRIAWYLIGFLSELGALRWDGRAPSADGLHRGALIIDYPRMESACRQIMAEVVGALTDHPVDGRVLGDLFRRHHALARVPLDIVEARDLGSPELSVVYSVRR